MRVLITGAAGMIGRKLVARLAASPTLDGRPIDGLTLMDTVMPLPPAGFPGAVIPFAADLAAPGVAEAARDRLKPGGPMPLAGRDDAPIVRRWRDPAQGSRSSRRFGPSASDERRVATTASAVGHSSGGAGAIARCFP